MAQVSRDPSKSVFAIRPVGNLVAETHESGHELKRAVGSTQLTAMGVGAIIGTGIFVVVGEGALIAGPAVILSFALAAVACVFSALSYAELASSIKLGRHLPKPSGLPRRPAPRCSCTPWLPNPRT
jgi:amino acid permease